MSPVDATSLELFEKFADAGAFLVIVGVLGEGFDIALKICKCKCKNETFIEWYERNELWIEIFSGVFWIMVVGGLGMEFRYGHKAQQLVKTENSRITQEAGEARKVAGKAQLEAGKAAERAANADSNNLVLKLNVATSEHHFRSNSAWVENHFRSNSAWLEYHFKSNNSWFELQSRSNNIWFGSNVARFESRLKQLEATRHGAVQISTNLAASGKAPATILQKTEY